MLQRRQGRKRAGAVLPMVALCMVPLMGLLALAIDIGMVAVARSQCQNAADTAAMAGARTINGDSSGNYNYSAVPGGAFTAAVANKVLNQTISGNPGSYTTVNSYTYQTGQVTAAVGTYAYVYNDANPAKEGFQIQIPRIDNTEPYSAVQATVTGSNGFAFGRVFGLSSFNTSATATAIHRPRDVMIVVDLSGSMRFQSVPGVPLSGSLAAVSAAGNTRDVSMNPDPIFPQFGHYSDVAKAALQGTQTYTATSGEYVDLSNVSSTTNSGPPIVQDFYQNAVGVAPSAGNVAWTAAPSSYATAPGGDDYLKTSLDTSGTYAQTVAQFNNNSTTTNAKFEVTGYTSVRASFNGYTQGPGYWGKTFWVWPPAPRGLSVVNPPATLTDTTFNWYNNKSNDWRQRFFVAVNTATNIPSWVNHNTILFDPTQAGGSYMKKPGTKTTVTENGSSVSYTFHINYAAILYWLNQSPSPFPTTLQAGRIRYYTKRPDGTDNTLNNRWWTTNPNSLSNDERFWKEYIDFVLGYVGTGTNTYTNTNSGTPVSGLIGNGDYYTWTGSTIKISQRPQPQPSPSTPGAPYQSGTVNKAGGYSAGATTVAVSGLGSTPTANKDYVIVNGNTANPYLVTGGSSSSLNISPGLAAAVANNASVQVYSPYMDYSDNPPRPRHQYWFGPLTMVDWLGNYNLYTLVGNSAPHHWWPGNCHEAQAWACKVGIQTAIDDIQKNHPNDFVGMTFFSAPKYSNGGSGHHNRAVVSMGRSYQQLKDSLWFPPSTVTGGVAEIGPYDADMLQAPRADGGTTPGMGFMIAYNQLSSSVTNLRPYASPQPLYRGDAGGLGRKGAQRLLIFETDGFPNTRAVATLVNSGSDSYYPIRIKNPQDLTAGANVEWPSGGSYADNEVYAVVQQICALNTANPPGYSTSRTPVLVHCIGYGTTFDPANAGASQTAALDFLQHVQFYGNTSADTNGANFPANRRIYGTNPQRIAAMQQAFTNIMQSGIQVSLIQ